VKVIVWRAPDGTLKITVPVDPPQEGETEAGYLDRIAARAQAAIPDLADHERVGEVEHTSLPDRSRRANWRWNVATKGVI
jgi:hypothetical protein